MTSRTQDREIISTRVFASSPERVFDAFTHADQVDQWWGPDGFTTKTTSMDVRPGGAWIFTMSHAKYGNFTNRIRYHEVSRPTRLAYTHDAGQDEDPAAFEVTVTFEARGDKTQVTLFSIFPTVQHFEDVKKHGAIEGARQTLEHLEQFLTRQ